jgi:hypothetical protein
MIKEDGPMTTSSIRSAPKFTADEALLTSYLLALRATGSLLRNSYIRSISLNAPKW